MSVIPSTHGQSVVMRILDKDSIKVGLRQLGFSDEDFHRLRNLISRPNGIILVTGPTGSGKTTSLYAALNDLNTPDRKIITAEDPVEYYLPGVNQVEVRHEIGLDFARVIRAMLRQAPNIILVGEMRDLEDGPDGNSSFLDWTLGFQYTPYERCAQRHYTFDRHGCPSLPRRQQRRRHHGPTPRPRRLPKMQATVYPKRNPPRSGRNHPRNGGTATFSKGRGCGNCQGAGFRGRLGIFELMLMSSKVRELTFNEAPTEQIRRAAVGEGMKTLYWDGIDKVLRGVTTLEEVFRVAKRSDSE